MCAYTYKHISHLTYKTAYQHKHTEEHKHHYSKHYGGKKNYLKKISSLTRSLFYSEKSCSSVKFHGFFCITMSSYQEEIWLKPKTIYLLPTERHTFRRAGYCLKALRFFYYKWNTKDWKKGILSIEALTKPIFSRCLRISPLTAIPLQVQRTSNRSLKSMAYKRQWRKRKALIQGKGNWGRNIKAF